MSELTQAPRSVRRLLDRGVILHSPLSVEIDDSVSPERISPGVVIHAGCKISGAETSIGPGSKIGQEAPATIENCQLGHGVELKGGFFSNATFLDKSYMGSGAHVRAGTLLEEESGAAHTVGFKQTIFFPFVTAGSLINFCDALMAGGTGRKDHGEIGSSYIHFNFTPHQDKATASLIGDVPLGVFLNQPPVFLGGQGGLVGPARIAYGVVLPAGVICRQDVLEEGALFVPRNITGGSRKFVIGAYRDIGKIVEKNLLYIGNLWALSAWYSDVRVRAMSGDPFREACRIGALERIKSGLDERIRRLKELADKMTFSLQCGRSTLPRELQTQQQMFKERWPEMETLLRKGPDATVGAVFREMFLDEWEQTPPTHAYIEAIKSLSPDACATGATWLQAIVAFVTTFCRL